MKPKPQFHKHPKTLADVIESLNAAGAQVIGTSAGVLTKEQAKMWRIGKDGSVYKVKKRGSSRRKTYGTKARAKRAARRR